MIGSLRQEGMEDPGGAVVAADLGNACGRMSRQCALEAVRILCPQMLGRLHAVGNRRDHGMAANSGRVDREERGEKHVAGRVCCQPHFLRGAAPSDAGNEEENRESRRRDAR